jgi:hypothetical protein
MERILYLHIGGPKTGTKTLQVFFIKTGRCSGTGDIYIPAGDSTIWTSVTS